MLKSSWAKFLLYSVVLAILGIFFLSYILYRGGSPREESVAVNSDKLPELVLGNFYPIAGTSYFLAEVFNDRPSSYLSYESARWSSFGTGGQTRNLVFLDGESLASRKLYDTNNSFLLSVAPFPQKSSNQVEQSSQEIVPTQWFVYYIVHQDSNKDDLLNENDLCLLAISDYNGLRYKEILGGVLELYELTMPQNGRLLVVYKLSDGRYTSLIDMQTQEIILTQPLPDLGMEVK
jgi:hypothetical protein